VGNIFTYVPETIQIALMGRPASLKGPTPKANEDILAIQAYGLIINPVCVL
jgi:hypothetical protein